MKIKLRDRFKNYAGDLCTVTALIKNDEVRVTYQNGKIETWIIEEFEREISSGRMIAQDRVIVNRTNIGDHLVEYELNMIGKTIADAKKDDMWFYNFTYTEEQHQAFKAYAIPLIKKVFKCNKKKAEETFDWFNLNFGLRVKN